MLDDNKSKIDMLELKVMLFKKALDYICSDMAEIKRNQNSEYYKKFYMKKSVEFIENQTNEIVERYKI